MVWITMSDKTNELMELYGIKYEQFLVRWCGAERCEYDLYEIK